MKFECKCGNQINEHHGKYTKVRAGKEYYLFYCKECKSSIKVNHDSEVSEYDYRLQEKA